MMQRIAKLAQASNRSADEAIEMTTTAVETVTNTVDSINKIRDTIRETEKRIKRLGERSQEISTAVNLINNIAERTHILALNASMHAASAGEAGRGFAVVADEVQRLAENAREATSQISTLVNNIQVETASTVSTMNELITQVVGGSKLAEEAGEQMRVTQTTTTELVRMVQKIAAGATAQANTSTRLRDRTEVIRETVRKTGSHLQEQSAYTDQLVENAMALVASVGVFQTGDTADTDNMDMDNIDDLDNIDDSDDTESTQEITL
ncbi:MAG: methyl-accepting chemotaxis protein [Gammaproteobacteria bacterium]|nr:methyl-accepting chemotaxis protein [Gammaproteobacteria bacterium]